MSVVQISPQETVYLNVVMFHQSHPLCHPSMHSAIIMLTAPMPSLTDSIEKIEQFWKRKLEMEAQFS